MVRSSWVVAAVGMALVAFATPSQAWVIYGMPKVTVDVDPYTGTVKVSVCWEHDPDVWEPKTEIRDGVGAWVPQGTEQSDGSLYVSAGDPSCEFDPLGPIVLSPSIPPPSLPEPSPEEVDDPSAGG